MYLHVPELALSVGVYEEKLVAGGVPGQVQQLPGDRGNTVGLPRLVQVHHHHLIPTTQGATAASYIQWYNNIIIWPYV